MGKYVQKNCTYKVVGGNAIKTWINNLKISFENL